AVVTDPPYPAEHLPLYGELAEHASRLLKPGGICAAMCGQSYLPEVLGQLGAWLTYHWTLAYLTPGGQSAQLWQRRVNTFWKPVLVFTNGAYPKDAPWLGDVVRSAVNDNDKRHHHWGQSESGMADLLQRLTQPGQVVCDPLMGGGTTGVAAVGLGRSFIGCDLDGENVLTALQRLQQCQERLEVEEADGDRD
ncbi:MAG: site-specific DNA-methyltransferase, partial [Sporichthyaceae bacterium]|nr:site-specific DNA-methyltransferase [Sporichthyaceae bacterium]